MVMWLPDPPPTAASSSPRMACSPGGPSQNVTFAAGAAGVRRADAALALVGLAAVADRPVGDLTATQKRRVSLAKALVHDPGVLLLDDPFAGLADADRADLQDALLGIQAETGVTVVIATRNVDEAVRLADRVAVLSPLPGRVVTQVPVNSGRPHAARHAVWAALAGVEGYAAAA